MLEELSALSVNKSIDLLKVEVEKGEMPAVTSGESVTDPIYAPYATLTLKCSQ